MAESLPLEIIRVEGRLALPNASAQRLLPILQATVSTIEWVTAQYQHFVEVKNQLGTSDYDKLKVLLTYGPKEEVKLPHQDHSQTIIEIIVVPRYGTISPWSTRATDIAHICNLDKVVRIERGVTYYVTSSSALSVCEVTSLADLLYDRMTETVLPNYTSANKMFVHHKAKKLNTVDILIGGRDALTKANIEWGLALANDEIDYLMTSYQELGRNPTDVELMMFGQVNSEHCRHKIFNADFIVDGKQMKQSLFQMIRHTYNCTPHGILSAYSDNASVIEGSETKRLLVDPSTRQYSLVDEMACLLMKVETHNHPTAIAPHPGALTGCGGEIRDEAAVGKGSKPKAGLTGYTTSHLHIPGHRQPWETAIGTSDYQASALQIMLQAPIGGASFNNEFGRPNLTGYFRTMTETVDYTLYGYHKPIMLAGGMGNIRHRHISKGPMSVGAHLVVIGGPAMLIGLGGGAASSMASGGNTKELDFASVQRGNPEMQRRCQEVIDTCVAMGDSSPIEFIHDVGAGGLCNAFPELVHDGRLGGVFRLRDIPTSETGLSPLELWCNEAQERFVLAINPSQIDIFANICKRERCIYAVVGIATEEKRICVVDSLFSNHPIDLPSSVLFGKPPRVIRNVTTKRPNQGALLNGETIDIMTALTRVLQFPAVASKSFLITIGDRSVTGMVTRDQMVGKWQVPVADVAVTTAGYDYEYRGEAMAIGEKPPLAIFSPASSARMAIGEAITNICAASIKRLSDIRLSANWMAACGKEGQDAALYEAVQAIGVTLCPQLELAIPVGKDSLSMWSKFRVGDTTQEVISPVSLIATAFSPVLDVRTTLTPELQLDTGDTVLILLDPSGGKTRTACSSLAQTFNTMSGLDGNVPDMDDPASFISLFNNVQALLKDGTLLAYHDRSDGGLIVCVLEMCFASHCGVTLTLPSNHHPLPFLFAEELGVVIQVYAHNASNVLATFRSNNVAASVIGQPNTSSQSVLVLTSNGTTVLSSNRVNLHRLWAKPSYHMQSLRDNPQCAKQEYDWLLDINDPGLSYQYTFSTVIPTCNVIGGPKVAILREQGVNGHIEMAFAFQRVGFTSVDVHMSDILSQRVDLKSFVGVVCCGGFSYGDVLGAGGGWANSILFHEVARQAFSDFIRLPNTFILGICNGCQMLTALKSLLPGTEHWPRFVTNRSNQFEARTCMVEIVKSHSIFFKGMEGSKLPIPVAHAEGLAEFENLDDVTEVANQGKIALRYVDNYGNPTETYPANPNGSTNGITGLTTNDGRVTVMMPHPERVVRTCNNSWSPPISSLPFQNDGPWLRMFQNAYDWVQAAGNQ